MRASAAWETGREGKGLSSWSLPSSCQPGKVARRMKQKKARMTAMILLGVSMDWFDFLLVFRV